MKVLTNKIMNSLEVRGNGYPTRCTAGSHVTEKDTVFAKAQVVEEAVLAKTYSNHGTAWH